MQLNGIQKVEVSKGFRRVYERLPQSLRKRIDHTLVKLAQYPALPGLNIEPVRESKNAYSCRVTDRIRLTYKITDSGRIQVLYVGPHDLVYQKAHLCFMVVRGVAEIPRECFEGFMVFNPSYSGEECAVTDGVVDKELFEKANYKILWILKEANNADYRGNITNKNWDLCNFLYDISNKVYSYWKNTYGRVIKVSYGVLNNFPEYESIGNTEEQKDVLRRIAIVNVKKQAGGKRSDPKELEKYFDRNKNQLFEQIKEINPDIVICGGTGWLFKKVLVIKDKNCYILDRFSGFRYKNQVWIDAYHPGALINYKVYYNNILGVLKHFLGEGSN